MVTPLAEQVHTIFVLPKIIITKEITGKRKPVALLILSNGPQGHNMVLFCVKKYLQTIVLQCILGVVRSKTYISFYKEKTSLENLKDSFLVAFTDLTVNKREIFILPVEMTIPK